MCIICGNISCLGGCDPINLGYVCDNCPEETCIYKIDADCVLYHKADDRPSGLTCLGIANKTPVSTILEIIDKKLCSSAALQTQLTAEDSNTIDFSTSGVGLHTLTADVKVSSVTNNAILIKDDGIFAPNANGKLKVNSGDNLDYLVNQLVGGTDGIVSLSPQVTNGQLVLLPSINIECLLNKLRSTYLDRICELNSNCQPGVCVAVSIPDIELSDAYISTPYNYTITLTGTGPFVLSDVVKPSWMTITVLANQIIFTGTPVALAEDVAVSFKIANCDGIEEYIDVLDVLPICNIPSNLTITSITLTSATAHWTAAIPAPSAGYDWILYKINTDSSLTQITQGNTATTSVNLTGLSTSTLYSFYVRSQCALSCSNYIHTEFSTDLEVSVNCSIGGINPFSGVGNISKVGTVRTVTLNITGTGDSVNVARTNDAGCWPKCKITSVAQIRNASETVLRTITMTFDVSGYFAFVGAETIAANEHITVIFDEDSCDTQEITCQGMVQFEDLLPGHANQWAISLTLPAPAAVDTTFTIVWTATNTNPGAGTFAFTEDLIIAAGTTTNSLEVTTHLTQTYGELWTVNSQSISSISPAGQFVAPICSGDQFMAFWTVRDNNDPLTVSEIESFEHSGVFEKGLPVIVNFSADGAGYLTMAEPISEDLKDQWQDGEILSNFGNVGSPTDLYDAPVAVSSKYRVYTSVYKTETTGTTMFK